MTLPPYNPADNRLFPLDALRGFAVMGILLMNITAFALPDQAYVNPAAWGLDGWADVAAWALGFILVDGKMRGLFSLLFGASMLLVIDRAELAGQDGRRAHLARTFWLFLIGVAHFVLLWWGDILMIYALVSIAALFFVHRQPLDLVKWAFIAFGVHLLIVAASIVSLYVFRHDAMLPRASAELMTAFDETMGIIGQPGSPAIAEQIAIYRSGFDAIVTHQLHALEHQFTITSYAFFDTLGFMLLGMAMLKGGFLNGQWEAEQYRRVARHCFLIGLPPMAGLALWGMGSHFDALTMFALFVGWSFPFRIPLTVGFAALFLMLIQRSAGGRVMGWVAAAGRMTLSNYLGTSLLMTALFYGWCFGLFGHLSRAALFPIVPLVWAVMLLWSNLWLRRFAYGPVEWIWRSLSRRRLQPLRRKSIAT